MAYVMMSDLLTPDRIIPALRATDRRQVVEKLCQVASRSGLKKETVRRAVLSREDLTTFAVGRGIAIPHAIVADIRNPLGVFARLEQPVDFGAADGRRADLVFLLLVPKANDRLLLPALACVARRLRDAEVAKHLRAATSAEAAHVILATDIWRRCAEPDRKDAA